jgi:hypothetical protein
MPTRSSKRKTSANNNKATKKQKLRGEIEGNTNTQTLRKIYKDNKDYFPSYKYVATDKAPAIEKKLLKDLDAAKTGSGKTKKAKKGAKTNDKRSDKEIKEDFNEGGVWSDKHEMRIHFKDMTYSNKKTANIGTVKDQEPSKFFKHTFIQRVVRVVTGKEGGKGSIGEGLGILERKSKEKMVVNDKVSESRRSSLNSSSSSSPAAKSTEPEVKRTVEKRKKKKLKTGVSIAENAKCTFTTLEALKKDILSLNIDNLDVDSDEEEAIYAHADKMENERKLEMEKQTKPDGIDAYYEVIDGKDWPEEKKELEKKKNNVRKYDSYVKVSTAETWMQLKVVLKSKRKEALEAAVNVANDALKACKFNLGDDKTEFRAEKAKLKAALQDAQSKLKDIENSVKEAVEVRVKAEKQKKGTTNVFDETVLNDLVWLIIKTPKENGHDKETIADIRDGEFYEIWEVESSNVDATLQERCNGYESGVANDALYEQIKVSDYVEHKPEERRKKALKKLDGIRDGIMSDCNYYDGIVPDNTQVRLQPAGYAEYVLKWGQMPLEWVEKVFQDNVDGTDVKVCKTAQDEEAVVRLFRASDPDPPNYSGTSTAAKKNVLVLVLKDSYKALLYKKVNEKEVTLYSKSTGRIATSNLKNKFKTFAKEKITVQSFTGTGDVHAQLVRSYFSLTNNDDVVNELIKLIDIGEKIVPSE